MQPILPLGFTKPSLIGSDWPVLFYQLPEISREHCRKRNLDGLKTSINLSQDFQTSISLWYFGGKHSLKSKNNTENGILCEMFLLWSFPYLRPVKDRGCHLCSLVAVIIDCQLKVVSHDDCWTLDSVLCSPCPAWSCLPSPALPALPGSCSHGLARKRSTLAPWSQNKRTVLGSLAKWMLQTNKQFS